MRDTIPWKLYTRWSLWNGQLAHVADTPVMQSSSCLDQSYI